MKRYPYIFSFLLLCLSTYLYAQQTTPSADPSQSSPKPISQEFDDFLAKESSTKMTLSEQLLKAENEYKISNYKHRRKTFDWQHTSSVIIFWVVILIVLVGLFFAGMQFYISLKQSKSNIKNNNETSEKQENATSFEASLSGIKVSSSVIGIIILVISLAFFYLYLVYVYPVNEVKRIEQTEEEKSAK